MKTNTSKTILLLLTLLALPLLASGCIEEFMFASSTDWFNDDYLYYDDGYYDEGFYQSEVYIENNYYPIPNNGHPVQVKRPAPGSASHVRRPDGHEPDRETSHPRPAQVNHREEMGRHDPKPGQSANGHVSRPEITRTSQETARPQQRHSEPRASQEAARPQQRRSEPRASVPAGAQVPRRPRQVPN
jgi:hypothetical protein